jgi:DNA-binding transcriptional regulator YiaG
MTALALYDTPDMHTSAVGSMYRSGIDATIAAMLIATTLSGPATASTYAVPRLVERTAAGPAGQIEHVPAESTAEAILEIRRRSGLTWEELGDLFDVSRRSVHHWASGKPVSAKHDQMIRRMLAAIRHFDQGSQAGTRAQLLAVDGATGVSALDLLKDGLFDEAMARVEGVRAPEHRRIPLSRTARDARRPQSPRLLLEAEQERPDIPAKARVGRAARTPNKTG